MRALPPAKVTVKRLVQSANAQSPTSARLAGMVTLRSDEQPWNALDPSVASRDGSVTDESDEQPSKALPLIRVTKLGMVTYCSAEQPANTRRLSVSRPEESVRLLRPVQKAKASLPRLVTVLGRTTEPTDEH